MAKSYVPHMHTAEHILNRTMQNQMHCDRSFSAHINSKKSKCDYHFDRDLTAEEAANIERIVNEELSKHHPVTEEVMPIEDAKTAYNLAKLPSADIETIRIVHIGTYDSCPCIGEHTQNTAEVGTFSIISHSHADGVLRIRFKCKSS